jgi:hypothetical protein
MELINTVSMVLLALFTAVYVFVTHRILRSNQQMLQEQNRPYVIAGLPAKDLEVVLSIKNTGRRLAHNVVITFDPPLETIGGRWFDKSSADQLLRHSSFPPEFEVSGVVNVTPALKDRDPASMRFKVHSSYFDSGGKAYSEEYEISLSSYVFERMAFERSLRRTLELIAKAVEKVSEAINDLAKQPE